jgi:hypothetical protein
VFQQVGIADDGRQDVVEVVGDAGSEPPDEIDLLQLPELLFVTPARSLANVVSPLNRL